MTKPSVPPKLSVCLWLNQQAREAAEFYSQVFPQTVVGKSSPMITELTIAGQPLLLLDGGPMFSPNPAISFYYLCETQTELESVWNALQAGGQVMMPLDAYDWSPQYGWLADKFGVSWQVGLGKWEDVEQKVTPCFLFTGSVYGRGQEAIDLYARVFGEFKMDGILRFGPDEAPDREGCIKHAQFGINGQKFMLMESGHNHSFQFTEGVSIVISCNTQEEINYYWAQLTENGQESMCGWLKDPFGISWQVVPVVLSELMRDPSKMGLAMKAFRNMRKFDIAQIQAVINEGMQG